MGRFAIDRAHQGAGLGAELLREALLSAVAAGRLTGARVMLVDAISENAAAFYQRFGFEPSPIHSMQLLRDLARCGRLRRHGVMSSASTGANGNVCRPALSIEYPRTNWKYWVIRR